MATVRFSSGLKRSILRAAGDLYDERINAAKGDFPDTWGDTIYALMFKDTVARMDALPDNYMDETASISIWGFEGAGWDTTINHGLNLRLSRSRRFPSNAMQEIHGVVTTPSYGALMLDADDSRWGAFKAEYLAYCEAIAAIDAECETFRSGVEKVIETYSTLAPALKAWPALWDLLPEETKMRHKEIKERQTRTPAIEGDVDLGRMTAAVTLNKLTR